jgi:hypothetical protein
MPQFRDEVDFDLTPRRTSPPPGVLPWLSETRAGPPKRSKTGTVLPGGVERYP